MAQGQGTTRTALVSVMLLLGVSFPRADDNDRNRRTLQGLPGVGVIVEDVDPEAERDGLHRSDLQTDAELKLRLAGIRVLNVAEQGGYTAAPYLSLKITTVKRDGSYTYAGILELRQIAQLANPEARQPRDFTGPIAFVTTWSVGSVGGMGQNRVSEFRDAAKTYADQFINAWLSVNPKR